ncbi:MAG TPA: SPW repeat protein [Rubrobacter sp.]|nr:SPW repeat protein [Rubrobacter sp.]
MAQRGVSTKTHGVLDLASAGTLLAAPRLLGLESGSRAASVLRMAGGGAAAYSMITDYEFGVVGLLPMRVHLALDAASGAFLAASPWLFGFAKNGPRYWAPHVLMGAGEVLAALASRTR